MIYLSIILFGASIHKGFGNEKGVHKGKSLVNAQIGARNGT